MKKIFGILLVMTIFLNYSCERDLSSEGVSKVTTYVVLTLQGEHFMTIPQGTAFTDPGITAKEGEEDATVTITGTVDSNTPGVYTLTYTSVNKDGYSVSDSRIVGVIAASAASNDFSGRYARSTNQSVAVWTKVAPGMYTVFNPGGAPGTNLTIHAFNPTGNTIVVPQQVSSDGSITAATTASGGPNITYNPTGSPSYVWVIVNAGYGTAARTFNKL